jgi:hypothetical protein
LDNSAVDKASSFTIADVKARLDIIENQLNVMGSDYVFLEEFVFLKNGSRHRGGASCQRLWYRRILLHMALKYTFLNSRQPFKVVLNALSYMRAFVYSQDRGCNA